ncbi:hypothetical protein BDN70DRAFT_874071 [Pholiota conissans]|uniref:BRCT domain-containing protein n=1 Tax=Pholiota conissans TaxID=109636 RepID=A0A9P5Z8U4_9AGAR|nr:hypothetical protein BDN70DRAFT_874071 [Pholiota conissans]
MRRRGNKSSKVPNVKLRPADKGAYSRPVAESWWAQDTQASSDDVGMYDACPRPMKGIFICATGVPDKPTIFKQAVELGAACTPAFTDRVTHLVAVDHGGAKYTCALQRKIPIVKPSWITENYQIWLKGDDVDVHQSVDQHRLPIFSGVVVCPSGITDITRRTQINKLVRQHDGAYLKDLERPVRVTHLLCSGDEDTEKMKYAEKFNARGEAQIHLVWEEWFWDSLDFGGRFDEATYQVRRPRPERKKLPEARSSPPPPSSTVPSSQHDECPSPSYKPKPQQSAQANADGDEEEPAFVNVLPDVMLQLWGGLLERRGYQITDGEVILSPSKKAAAQKTTLPPPESPARQQFGAARSVLSSFRRQNSFAPAAPPKEPGTSRPLPFKRTTSSNAQAGPSKIPDGVDAAASESESKPSVQKQIFAGMRVRALGEAKSAAVRNAVEQLGGVMSIDEDEDVDFIIVRLVTGSKLYRMEEGEALRRKYRTECWLEQCMFEERICAPDEKVMFVPLGVELPIPGAENLLVSMSGFYQSETLAVQRLFRALGITLASTLLRRSTHLLCPSAMGPKFEKAREWEIPVVGMEWVAAIASTGGIPPVHGFTVAGSFVPPRIDDESMDVEMEVVGRKDLKGKGKAVGQGSFLVMEMVEDPMMHDITNNSNTPPDHPPAQKSPTDTPSSRKGKSKPLTQEPTVLISDEPESEQFLFGMPNDTLGGSYIAHPSSIATPTRSILGRSAASLASIEESLAEAQKPPQERELHTEDTFDFSDSIARQRGCTAAEVAAMRIPSSKSPSPMRAPALARSSSRASLSPVKIDIDYGAAKALQDNITSLLGKRPAPDSADGGVGVAGAGVAGQAAGRNGKRARPQRAKTQSRQPSHNKIGGQSEESSTLSTRNAKSNDNAGLPEAFNNAAAFASNSYADDLSLGGAGEESMRVMYEDPGQRDEKRRLMSLLKNQSGSEEESRSGSRRRSTRIAGF